jgi:ATP-binding cassette subfamily B protein
VGLSVGEKVILKNISLSISKGSKVAIIGPTAAGKTQLLQLLIGLTPPTTGEIRYGEYPLSAYHKAELYKQLGLVFQESAIFHLSLRENIAFNTAVSSAAVEKALKTAELSDFIMSLPDGLDTLVSERGTSLSGGQKQRVMLARALAIDPKILLLDDFTARVDTVTEQKILANLEQNYPGLTLVSVTQKIGAIAHYDHIIVLMEGEVIGVGTHQSLMETCPEYVQIYTSQQSTNTYELSS